MSRYIKVLICGISITCVVLGSCTSHTYDDIEVIDDIEIPEIVTYNEVRPIFEANCTVCHANPPQNGAPMSLTTFTAVKNAVIDRGLLDRISRDQGAEGMMPLGGQRLPQQSIDLVFQWNEDGLLEN